MKVPRYTLAVLLAVGMVGTLTAAAAADPGPGRTAPDATVTTVPCPEDEDMVPALPALPAEVSGATRTDRLPTRIEIRDGKVYVDGKEVGDAEGMAPAGKAVAVPMDGKDIRPALPAKPGEPGEPGAVGDAVRPAVPAKRGEAVRPGADGRPDQICVVAVAPEAPVR